MNYLESIFNSIDEGLMILAPGGDLLYFNEEASRLLYKLDISLTANTNVFEVFPPEIVTRIQTAFEEEIGRASCRERV